MLILQQILNGITVGGVLALFAVGFTLVFGILRILNLAHGAVFMWGSLIGLFLTRNLGLPLLPAIALAMVGAGLLSVAMYATVMDPLQRRGSDVFGPVLASLGIAQILESVAQIVTQTQVQRYPSDVAVPGSLEIFGLHASWFQALILAAATILTLLMYGYLGRTRQGLQIRTVAADADTASLVGINHRTVGAQVFFLSGALSGAAGVLIGIAFNSVHFLMGQPYLLSGIVVVVLGGLGSLGGALVAGLGLGIITSLTVAFLPAGSSESIVWLLLLLALVARPTGLFGVPGSEMRMVRR